MTSILMNQFLEDQFLHWCRDMERKQEEQARQMKEFQDQAERLQRKNDQLWAQIKKCHDLGKDTRESGRDAQPIARDKEKGPFLLTTTP